MNTTKPKCKLDKMANYHTWEKEWFSAAITNRKESMAACQHWLDIHYPGAQVVEENIGSACYIVFPSNEEYTHFILKWG